MQLHRDRKINRSSRYDPIRSRLPIGRVLDHIRCIDVVSSPPRRSRYISLSHCALKEEQRVAPSRPRQRIITIDPDQSETSAKLIVLNTTDINLLHHLCLKIWRPPSKRNRSLDGEQHCHGHNRRILGSGWWGFSRHANYLGDLMQPFALGFACNSSQFLPWAFTFFLSSLIINRIQRDEARCRRKYGEDWANYCRRVRWILIPGIH